MNRANTRTSRSAILLACSMALAIALAGVCALSQSAQAEEEVEYFIKVSCKNVGVKSYQTFYGKPGETVNLSIKPKAVKKSYYDEVEGVWVDGSRVNSVKYKWEVSKKLKAKVASGNKLVIKKLPKVAKTYYAKLFAYDKNGNFLCQEKIKIIVKKKPKVSIRFDALDDDYFILTKNVSALDKDSNVDISLIGAHVGWDNNAATKPFYTITIKNLDTGKSVKLVNKKVHEIDECDFVEGRMASGEKFPRFSACFTQAGKFKVSAVIYHGNKKIATGSKTVTVS